MITFNPALTGASNNPLLAYLNPNQATTPVTPVQTIAQPMTPTNLGVVSPQAATTPTFSMPANGNMFAQQGTSLGMPNTFQFANQTPTATASNATGNQDIAGLDAFLQNANIEASKMKTSPIGENTAVIPANAPRSASYPVAPAEANNFILTAGALQQGQNPTGETEESSEASALEDKIKALESKIAEVKGTPSSDSEEKIAALEKQLDEAKINKNDEAFQARLANAEKQIKGLKTPKSTEIATAPKAKSTPTVPTTTTAKAPAKATPKTT